MNKRQFIKPGYGGNGDIFDLNVIYKIRLDFNPYNKQYLIYFTHENDREEIWSYKTVEDRDNKYEEILELLEVL